jgi:chromosome segregation ATPase
MIENARLVCDDLREQMESWRDNLPENFQDKASQLGDCIEALEQVISSLDEAESNAESVEFPGMY